MLTKATNSMINGASVNVLDYGADPTGVGDSTTAIQAAIDAAEVIGASVIFPAGTYKTATIEVGDNTRLIGTGGVISIGVLSDYAIKNKDTVSGNSGIIIAGLVFNGNSATSGNYSVVTLTNCEATIISDNEFYDCANFAVSIFGANSKVVIKGNTIRDGLSSAINVNGTTGAGTKIIGNTVYNFPASGIVVQNGASHVLVDGNDCSYCGTTNGNGISVGNSSDCVISNNICRYNSYDASAGSGIGANPTVVSSYRNTFVGNICEYNGDDGIDIACASPLESKYHTVHGNILNHNKTSGVNIGGTGAASFITVQGNQCQNNNLAGINLDSGGKYSTVVGNVCVDNGQGGSLTPGIRVYDDNTVVVGNILRNTGSQVQRGVYVSAAGCTVLGNQVTNTTNDPVYVSTDNDQFIGFNYGGGGFKAQSSLTTLTGATPSVANGKIFKVNNSTTTNTTDFTGGMTGQEITLLFQEANTTLVHSSTALRLSGGVNFTASANDSMTLVHNGVGWIETSRTLT